MKLGLPGGEFRQTLETEKRKISFSSDFWEEIQDGQGEIGYHLVKVKKKKKSSSVGARWFFSGRDTLDETSFGELGEREREPEQG